jgi:uncharacterized LabA/DUF88 family protein
MRIREGLVDVGQVEVDSGNELGGIAVFFDLENIIFGLHDSFKVKTIIDHLTERGEVMIRRAYADWGRYRSQQRQFLEEGIQMVFLPSYGQSDKNRTDTAICVDAMEILFRREHIDTFVICSGDSDFGVLAQRLRDYGKRVVGVSARSAASQILVKQCHEFIFYESLVGVAMTDYSRDEGESRLKRALNQLVDEYGRKFRASLLKDRMRKHDSTFSEKNYGASNFTRFLKNYGRLVRVLDGGKVEVVGSFDTDATDSGPSQASGRSARSPRSKPAAAKAEEVPGSRTESSRAESSRAEPNRTERSRTETNRTETNRTETNRTETNRTETNRTESKLGEPDRPPRSRSRRAASDGDGQGRDPGRRAEQNSSAKANVNANHHAAALEPEVARRTADLLSRAFFEALGDADAIRMSVVKDTLLFFDPEFDEGRLGFRSFASFLKAFPEVVRLDRHRDRVRPAPGATPPAEAGEPEAAPPAPAVEPRPATAEAGTPTPATREAGAPAARDRPSRRSTGKSQRHRSGGSLPAEADAAPAAALADEGGTEAVSGLADDHRDTAGSGSSGAGVESVDAEAEAEAKAEARAEAEAEAEAQEPRAAVADVEDDSGSAHAEGPEAAQPEGEEREGKKGAGSKSTAKKLTAKKSAAKKSTAKKSTAKKSTAKKSTAKKSTAKKSTAKKSTAKKSTAKKSTAKKSTAKKSTAKKSTAKKSTAKKSTAKKSTAKKSTAKKSTAKKSTAKKSTAKKSSSKKDSS